MIRIKLLTILTAIVLCASGPTFAVPIFDFESQPTGIFSSVSATNDGLTVTVTPEGFPNGFVGVQNPSTPGLGSVSLVGSQVAPVQFGRFAPLRFSFDRPVSFIEFLFGDAGGDDDSPVLIEAFSIGGNSLGTLNGAYPTNQASAFSLSGAFAGASYFIASSGSVVNNENSIFWEISRADADTGAVPAPATLALFGLGLAGLGWSRRKKA